MSLHPAFRAYLDELNPLVAQAVLDGFVPTPESARASLAGLSAFEHQNSTAKIVRSRNDGDWLFGHINSIL